MTSDPRTDLLLQVLDQAFDKKAWHGTTLRGSLRGLSPRRALWRPAPERHNVWEIVLHTAYWKYVVRRRLRQEKRGSFARPGSNWPELPEAQDPASWKRDVDLLRDEHRRLRETVAAFPASRLESRPPKSEWTWAALIYGAASHDLYHAGQIQLLKRLAEDEAP